MKRARPERVQAGPAAEALALARGHCGNAWLVYQAMQRSRNFPSCAARDFRAWAAEKGR